MVINREFRLVIYRLIGKCSEFCPRVAVLKFGGSCFEYMDDGGKCVILCATVSPMGPVIQCTTLRRVGECRYYSVQY